MKNNPGKSPGEGSGREKVALVTGGARGNGFAIAKGLAKAGATLFLGDIAQNIPEIPYSLSSKAILDEAVAALLEESPRVHPLIFDVRSAAEVESAFSTVEEIAGGVDILVNNAGVLALNPLPAVREAEWDVQNDIIAKGAYLCCRRALPGMIARGWGRIINISSVAGHRGIGTATAYTAAKHAMIGLTRSLAMEVAHHNLTVNAVCPGTVETDLVKGLGAALDMTDKEAFESFSNRHLTGRPIDPEDVAAAAVWLASEQAARINGSSLFVDDGWHAH